MRCQYFGICGSCKLHEYNYNDGLDIKIKTTKELFVDIYHGDFEIIKSDTSHFRYRAEFRLWHDGGVVNYAMNGYDKNIVTISSCEIVSEYIYTIMPKILESINSSDILKHKVFAIEFLSSTTGDLLITLIYHKKLDKEWSETATHLQNKLNIKLIGRSKGQKIVLSSDTINERLMIDRDYSYQFYENGFTQPNPKVNESMIKWVISHIKKSKDLIELYCGAGNFTIPLSHQFS